MTYQLPSWINYARNYRLYSISHVHLGMKYEQRVSEFLKDNLYINWSSQSGGHVGDEGVDLRGSWKFPFPKFHDKYHSISFYVIGQCKHTKNKVPTQWIREFEGVLQRNPNTLTVGLYISTTSMTFDSTERFRSSKFPMIFIQLEASDINSLILRHFHMNLSFQKLMPLLNVTKLYSYSNTFIILYDKHPILSFHAIE